MSKCKLSPLALGLACGILWGASVFFTALLAFYFSYGTAFVSAMGTMYIGYEATIIGSFIGGALAFLDGLIGGAIFAWLYNCFVGCCDCCSSGSHSSTTPSATKTKKSSK